MARKLGRKGSYVTIYIDKELLHLARIKFGKDFNKQIDSLLRASIGDSSYSIRKMDAIIEQQKIKLKALQHQREILYQEEIRTEIKELVQSKTESKKEEVIEEECVREENRGETQ